MARYTLPDLPYGYDALEPYIDEQTMRLHHDIHHLGYVNGANAALDKLEKAREAGDYAAVKAISRDLAFNASGHLLHSIFWPNMTPAGEGGEPSGALAEQLAKDFGGADTFRAHFSAAAKGVEGSGWGILGWEPQASHLLVLQAEKHQNLTAQGITPILVLDVWEHAYYLKYQNKRGDYVDNWWNIVNWIDVAERFEAARSMAAASR
ncbi:MAG: superoxide dismutase [Gemmatimonadota bacterium]